MTQGDGGDQAISLGSMAWNVADGYTKLKILKHLILLDRYENIAQYGTEELEEFPYDDNTIALRRIEALNRVLSTLRQVIGNVKFSIKKDNIKLMDDYIKDIDFVDSVIDGVSTSEENMVTHEKNIKINEAHFKNCLNSLRRIKNEINFPINDAGLIFRNSNEIDLDKIMKEIAEGG